MVGSGGRTRTYDTRIMIVGGPRLHAYALLYHALPPATTGHGGTHPMLAKCWRQKRRNGALTAAHSAADFYSAAAGPSAINTQGPAAG